MKRFLREMVTRYFAHDIPKSSAALAFYMLFSFFPLLIFINSLAAVLGAQDVLRSVTEAGLLPHGIATLIDAYLDHLSSFNSYSMMFTGLFFSLYFFSRAVNSMIVFMNRARRMPRHRPIYIRLAISLFFTVSMLVAFALILILLVAGRSIISAFPDIISPTAKILIGTCRYVFAGALLLAVLLLLYYLAPERRVSPVRALPGAFFAVAAELLLSYVVSIYVDHSSRYSLLYGSLAAVMLLMLWLYMSASVLLLGGELNDLLLSHSKKNASVGSEAKPI